jgi:hypothetical protein
MSVSGSRSARQCCAWQTVRGCCRQGVNRLRSRQCRVQPIQVPALGLRTCFNTRAVRREVPAAGVGMRARIGYCPVNNSNGAHMQVQAKALQAQQSCRQGQGQSQPNPSFKRTA